MKNVEPQRFQAKKPEEISFSGSPLPDNPQKKEGSARPDGRTSGRPDAHKPVQALKKPEAQKEGANVYAIEVPEQRRKIRHPFDIYEDQLEALKKIQIARRENTGSKEAPALGEMAREALEDFIKAEAKQSPNIKIFYEKDKNK